jgi:hypothetical protein
MIDATLGCVQICILEEILFDRQCQLSTLRHFDEVSSLQILTSRNFNACRVVVEENNRLGLIRAGTVINTFLKYFL